MTQSNGRLSEIYSEIQKQFLQSLSGGRNIFDHPGTKGEVSEKEWIGFLSGYLPKRYKCDSAFVMDSNGSLSEQIDIVIYDDQYTPRLYIQNGKQYIPAESVYAVFEVKQDLSAENIEDAKKKAASVRKLFRTSYQITHAGGTFTPRQPPKILAGLLTYTSSYTPWFSEKAIENIVEAEDSRRLDIGCIADSGSFTLENAHVVACEELPLAMFFMNLLKKLQAMGTVPAIDYGIYIKAIGNSLRN